MRERERLPGYVCSHFPEKLSAKILKGKEIERQDGTGRDRTGQDGTDGTASHTLDSSSASILPAKMGRCHTDSADISTGNI